MYTRGYTLLFAVLLSALVLSVSVSVLNIAQKEVLLSTSSRESTRAIYIADGMLDCAVLYDKQGYFTYTGNEEDYSQYVSCADAKVGVVTYDEVNSTTGRFTFHISDMYSGDESCAIVTVDKYRSGTPRTVIESRGYNYGRDTDGRCTAPHPLKVERAFRYSYTN